MYCLQHMTRGIYPDQKPFLFFCAHPVDETIREEICNELLETTDCCVWYLEQSPADQQEAEMLFSDLKEMQIFVFPVSRTFLKEPSYAKDQLLRFATEEKIQILPVILESGLEKEFKEAFGPLQYLLRLDSASNALSYRDRLAVFLNRHLLIPGKLSEGIASAFRARVFLSYRRQDRIKARELIEYIHSLPEFIDLEIWYDEYIIAGEDYNVFIDKAIDNCDLFLLLITPNTLEEGNFILKREYPRARDAGKPIVSCIIEPVDVKDVDTRFKTLSSCIGERQLADFLRRQLAQYPTVQSAQKQYYLGCAYCFGKNAERNVKRGLELLEWAADSKHFEAMLLLVQMVEMMNVTGLDVGSVIRWQKELIQYLKREYAAKGDPSVLLKLLVQSVNLGWFYAKLGQYADSVSFCLGTIQEYQALRVPDNTGLMLLKMNLYMLAAKGCGVLGQSGKSRLYYQTVVSEFRKNQQLDLDYSTQRVQTIAYEKLGTLAFEARDYKTALNYYQQLYPITKRMREMAERDEIALSPYELELNGRIGGDETLLLYTKKDVIHLQCEKDYCVALTKLGDVYLETKQWEPALRKYTEAKVILEALIKARMDVIPVRREYALLFRKLSDVNLERGSYGQALKDILRACELSEDIMKEHDTPENEWDLAVFYYQAGAAYNAVGQDGSAVLYLKKAQMLLKKDLSTPARNSFYQMLCAAINALS